MGGMCLMATALFPYGCVALQTVNVRGHVEGLHPSTTPTTETVARYFLDRLQLHLIDLRGSLTLHLLSLLLLLHSGDNDFISQITAPPSTSAATPFVHPTVTVH